MAFLPITKEDMLARGWDAPDIVVVTGDAYVDHPSFGTAIVSRVLEDAGFKVCILSQPQNDDDYRRFGRPNLAFFVNSGNIDSMVAHILPQNANEATTIIPPAVWQASVLTARLPSIARPSAVYGATFRSASAAWKPLCAVLHIMIIGIMPSVRPF